MITEDIPVKYINSTNQTDVQVVVFGKNNSLTTPATCYVAWQVLKVQGSVQFKFPADIEIGASYKNGSMTITAGPIEAELGSTWSIKQELMHDTATLNKVVAVPNPTGGVVIKNVAPKAWCGRKFDVGIYRMKHLFLIEKDLRVDTHVEFLLEPKLCFGIASNVKAGQVFDSLDMMTSLVEFDLCKYPYGIAVTLSEKPGGGQLVFTAEQLM